MEAAAKGDSAQPAKGDSAQPAKPAPVAAAASGKGRKTETPGLEDLINGRVLILGAMLCSIALLSYPPLNVAAAQFSDRMMAPYRKPPPTAESEWAPGRTATVDITVVTADVWRLACASDQVVEGTHCTNKSDKAPWPQDPGAPLDDNRKNVIQPYRTENGNLLITVAGLWAQPEIAMRVHREPPRVIPTKRQKRFTARCEVKFIGYLENTKLQWNTNSQWFDQPKVIVARAEKCELKKAE